MDAQSTFFNGNYNGTGCPFRGGMNQLWRNQMMALELEHCAAFADVFFSVVTHPENTFLDNTMNEFRELTKNSHKFFDFKSDSLVNAAFKYLPDWTNWYNRVYYGKE